MHIRKAFQEHGIELSDKIEDRFKRFLELFEAYNSHTNLSAIRNAEAIILLHFVDSCIVSKFLPLEGEILDIGTGGGFPGIPLAILHDEVYFTLLDSVGKKTRACEHFTRELWLANTQVVQDRAEHFREKQSELYDIVISRATAYMPDILTWGVPFLRSGGKIILLKSPSTEELQDGRRILKKLWLREESPYTYTLGGRDRMILIFTKT